MCISLTMTATGIHRHVVPTEDLRLHFPQEMLRIDNILAMDEDEAIADTISDVAYETAEYPNSEFEQAFLALKGAFQEKFRLPLRFGMCGADAEFDEEEISLYHFFIDHSDLYIPNPLLLDLQSSGISPQETTFVEYSD